MAAAAAAPGGELLCAEAGGGASARTKATPIEAKIALRIVVSPFCLPTAAPSSSRPFIRSSSGPANLALKLGHPYLHRAGGSIGPEMIGQGDQWGVASR